MKYLIYITALLAFFGCNSFSKFVPEKYFAEGSEREFATAIYNGNSRKIKKMRTDMGTMLAQKKPLESIQRSQAINFVAEIFYAILR